jgi:hypothetical protein
MLHINGSVNNYLVKERVVTVSRSCLSALFYVVLYPYILFDGLLSKSMGLKSCEDHYFKSNNGLKHYVVRTEF